MLGQDANELLVIRKRLFLSPAYTLSNPGRNVVWWFDNFVEHLKCVVHVTDDRYMSLFILVDFRWINIDVHDLCSFDEFRDLPGHPIVKTDTQGQH